MHLLGICILVEKFPSFYIRISLQHNTVIVKNSQGIKKDLTGRLTCIPAEYSSSPSYTDAGP